MSLPNSDFCHANASDMWLTHVEVGNDVPITDKSTSLMHVLYIPQIFNSLGVLTVEALVMPLTTITRVAPVSNVRRELLLCQSLNISRVRTLGKKIITKTSPSGNPRWRFTTIHKSGFFSGQHWHWKSYASFIRTYVSQLRHVSPRQTRNSLHPRVPIQEINSESGFRTTSFYTERQSKRNQYFPSYNNQMRPNKV